MAEVVNVHRADDFDVYIGRGYNEEDILSADPGERGWLGNPFKLEQHGGNYSREEAIEKFREMFLKKIETDEEFREAVENLRGKKLGCYCKPHDCHGDVIVEWLEGEQG